MKVVFFTKKIVQKMKPFAAAKIIICLVAFIVSMRVVNDIDWLMLIVDICFSGIVLLEQITLFIFSSKVNQIYTQFYTLILSEEDVDLSKKDALLLSYCVEYEAIKAFFKVRLSEKVKKSNEEELNGEWEEICGRIKIENEKILSQT